MLLMQMATVLHCLEVRTHQKLLRSLVNVKDDVVELVDKVESVTEPTLAGDTSVSYNLFNFEGADGSTIQSFNYDGVDYSLDQSLLPDATQIFSFTEGVVTISLNGDFQF